MEMNMRFVCFAALVLMSTLTPATARRGNKGNKIINGEDADITEAPYMAAIMVYIEDDWLNFCGASLLTPTKILTAAHCVEYDIPYTILMGVTDTTDTGNPNAQWIDVDSVKIYPKYDPNSFYFDYDIAILTLESPMVLNDYVNLIKLPGLFSGFPGTNCMSYGWGIQDAEAGTRDNKLKKGEFRTISLIDCFIQWGWDINYREVCIRSRDKSNCSGDSGSPLVCNGKAVGVVSWAHRDCEPSFANVLTRVYYYNRWVRENM